MVGAYTAPLGRISKLDFSTTKRMSIPNDTSSESSQRNLSNTGVVRTDPIIVSLLWRYRPRKIGVRTRDIHAIVHGKPSGFLIFHVKLQPKLSQRSICEDDCTLDTIGKATSGRGLRWTTLPVIITMVPTQHKTVHEYPGTAVVYSRITGGAFVMVIRTHHVHSKNHAFPYVYIIGCRTSHFEPREHVPRTSARAQHLRAESGRAPGVPRSREHEKRPTAGREKKCRSDKKTHLYIVIYGSHPGT